MKALSQRKMPLRRHRLAVFVSACMLVSGMLASATPVRAQTPPAITDAAVKPPGEPIEPPGEPIEPPGEPIKPPGEPIEPPGEDTQAQNGEPTEQPHAEPRPFRVAEAVRAPDWLRFGLSQRTRYEYLHNQFRASASEPEDAALFLRTLLRVGLDFEPIFIDAELADSRAFFLDYGTPVDTGLINPLELLQAHVGAEAQDLFTPGDAARIRAGRFTMDVGSRRLVARNRFRNTINAFTGLEFLWTAPELDSARAFITLPVEREPQSDSGLRDNRIRFDSERFDRLFWGTFFGFRDLPAELVMELYAFGLHERDSEDAPTSNRRLVTPGVRIVREPAPGALDLELEAAFQIGKSRSSAQPNDRVDLDHRARFTRLAVGYSFDVPTQPRLELHYDYASGDNDPNDTTNGRFDTLFGARRFELGPTGLYGALARSNLSSPGVRVEVQPLPGLLDAFVHYRAVWLARARDVWPAAGVRDPSGASGSFVGHQLEASVQVAPLPGNLELDVGFVHTFLGEFAGTAPNARPNADPSYLYAQVGGEI